MATSLTQYGVTINWTPDRPVMQSANGDWLIQGPITIPVGGLTPLCATVSGTFVGGAETYSGRVVHGAQLNPGNRVDTAAGTTSSNDFGGDGEQGFDSLPDCTYSGAPISNPAHYRAGLNVDPSATGVPLTITEGSLVKAVSNLTPTLVNPSKGRASLTDMVVFTVVTTLPAAGAFRPAIAPASKAVLWNESALNYGALPNLTPPGSAPSWVTAAGYVARLYQLGLTNNTAARNISPSNNHPEYGRDRGKVISAAALRLCTAGSNAEKRDTLVGLIQLGIDLKGRVDEGGIFYDLGGGNPGFKPAAVIAGLALGDAGMIASAANVLKYADDRHHFYVSQADVDQVRYTADGRPRDPYTVGMIGTPEWGEQHLRQPNRDASNFLTAEYRGFCGVASFGGVLAVRYMPGGQAAWANPVAFDYHDRFWNLYPHTTGGADDLSQFEVDMRTTFGAGAVAQTVAGRGFLRRLRIKI